MIQIQEKNKMQIPKTSQKLRQLKKPFEQNLIFQPQEDDFIKKIHLRKKNDRQNQIIMLHQKFKLTVLDQIIEKQQSKLQTQQIKQIFNFDFESVPYDAKFINDQLIIASNRLMPVRILNFNSVDSHQFSAFYDKKPNSQLFLAPIEFAVKGQKIVGGGRKFISLYDCQKIVPLRFKKMDKKYISTVSIIQENVVCFGEFSGHIGLFDIKSGEIIESIKPHVDAVYHFKSHPNDQNLLVSDARKDNFTYIWDRRKLTQFLNCFQIDRYSNQRYGLEFGQNNAIYTSGQSGQIYKTDLNIQGSLKPQIIYQDKLLQNVSDLVVKLQIQNCQKIYFSIGTRKYEFQQEKNKKIKHNPYAIVKSIKLAK